MIGEKYHENIERYKRVISSWNISSERKKYIINDWEMRKNLGINRLKYETYRVVTNGIVRPKPTIDTYKEIWARDKAEMLIGIELEVEDHAGRTRTLDDCLKPIHGNYYVCTDGSLSDGVEIVTAPRTIDEVRGSYDKYYQVLTALSRAGYNSHDSNRCGLHVHISKQIMPFEDWKGLRSWMCKESIKTLLKKASRRKSYSYCEFRDSCGSRYAALNLIPTHTAEFRFFRGTLNPASFLASIEIVLSLVSYWIKHKNDRVKGIKSYKRHLESGNYKHALKYLNSIDAWPTPAQRRIYTAEQRAANRLARLEARKNRDRYIRSYITDQIESVRCQIQDRFARQSTQYIHHDRNESELVPYQIPVAISGSWPQHVRRMGAQYTPTITVWAPRGLVEANNRNGVISAVTLARSVGWGRVSLYPRYNSISKRD